MPQSKIDTKNPSSSTDATAPLDTSTTHEGEPLSPTLMVSLHPLGLGSSAPEPTPPLPTTRRDAPPGRRSPMTARERKRGGTQAYGPGRRFNSRHRG
jgi:hypothetical protein